MGGQILSADTIQASILGCRTNRPGQVPPFKTQNFMKFIVAYAV